VSHDLDTGTRQELQEAPEGSQVAVRVRQQMDMVSSLAGCQVALDSYLDSTHLDSACSIGGFCCVHDLGSDCRYKGFNKHCQMSLKILPNPVYLPSHADQPFFITYDRGKVLFSRLVYDFK
jgi:hypothetical protein